MHEYAFSVRELEGVTGRTTRGTIKGANEYDALKHLCDSADKDIADEFGLLPRIDDKNSAIFITIREIT